MLQRQWSRSIKSFLPVYVIKKIVLELHWNCKVFYRYFSNYVKHTLYIYAMGKLRLIFVFDSSSCWSCFSSTAWVLHVKNISSIRHRQKWKIPLTYLSIWLSSSLYPGKGPRLVVVYKLSSVGSFAKLNSAWICFSDLGFSILAKTFFRLPAALAQAGTPTVWGVFLRQSWDVEMLRTGTAPDDSKMKARCLADPGEFQTHLFP